MANAPRRTPTRLLDQCASAGALLAFLCRHWHTLVTLLAWLALGGAYLGYMARTGATPLQTAYHLMEFLNTPLGPLLYLLVFAVRPLVFFSAALLTVVGGTLFGPLWGVLLTVVASNLSAAVAYGLGRLLGARIFENGQTGFVQRNAERLRRHSFSTVLVMNLMFVPFDLINYAAGVLQINFRRFLAATVVGSLPGIVACVLLGSSVQLEMQAGGLVLPQLDMRVLALAVALMLAGVAVAWYVRRTIARRGYDAP